MHDHSTLPDDAASADAIAALDATEVSVTAPVPSSESEEQARARVRDLVEKTRRARPLADAELVQRAYQFAAEKHAPQKRMTGEPYIDHPIAVAGILAELGMDDVSIAAGFLHDVPEDCGVSYEEMTERFGAEVAHLVEGVTKLKKIEFSSKQEKQAENLRKLFLAMAGDVRVIIIKLCDRLHNMRTLDPFPEKRKREIADETLHIFAPIAHRLGIWRIKWELEDRSFKYLEPAVYKQIYSFVQRTRAQRAEQVAAAIEAINERLKADGIEAEVSGRPKHFYSIYQKMVKQGLKFEAVHDLIALRIITNTVPDCYHALGVVHGLWMQVPEMFFDHISKPKPNNYQSLHTKVLDGNGDLVEIQIRTREMHREAEFGIAAHWRYKAGDAPEQNFGDKLRWLRLVLELEKDTQTDAQGFLDALKLDLSNDQVFVFTPDGDTIYLPQNSTPVDFAFRVHSEVGSHCIGAKVNGRLVPLSSKLHNGDICEIVTSRASKGPKRGWLDFVVTTHAKNRIKNFLRKQNFDDNVREGLTRLEKAAKTERLKLGNVADNAALQKCARQMGVQTTNELLAAIGYGEFSPENVLNRVRANVGEAEKTTKVDDGLGTLSGAASNILAKRPKVPETEPAAGDLEFALPQGETIGEITLDPTKADGLAYTLARCCAPIPGDGVRGYITRGRGVTVHRDDCPNLRHSQTREPGRLLAADWAGTPEKIYGSLIALECGDRTGLLADVTAIFAAKAINISSVNTYPLKNKRARLNISVTIANSRALDELVLALQCVPGVVEAHRV